MAAISLALEIERIEHLGDLALPGQQAAVRNAAWRSMWSRLQSERSGRAVNNNARVRLVSSRQPERT